MVENGNGQSGDETLKLTVSEEWTDGRNWFLGGPGQKLLWGFSSWDGKICCILRLWIYKFSRFFECWCDAIIFG